MLERSDSLRKPGDDLQILDLDPCHSYIEPANMAGQLHLDVANQEEQNWDFPRTLAPLTIREAKDKGVEYIMAARIFKNHNHFIARSIIPTSNGKTGVFTHDGMKHAGFSQLERGSVDELMTGSSPPVPPGSFTYAVIYRLRGGASAQDYFASRQLELCKKKLDVDLLTPTFLVPGFREMTENERIWGHFALSSQRHSWEFCRSQQNSPHEENSKVNLATQNDTGRVSLPPISALPRHARREIPILVGPSRHLIPMVITASTNIVDDAFAFHQFSLHFFANMYATLAKSMKTIP